MKTVDELHERYFDLEIEANAMKGTTIYNDILVERRTLAWVLDIPFKM